MRKFLILIFSILVALEISAQNDPHLKLWYTKPAKQWVEALPLGNGRLGAMVFGDPIIEVSTRKHMISLTRNS